jgi:hypothetical protein
VKSKLSHRATYRRSRAIEKFMSFSFVFIHHCRTPRKQRNHTRARARATREKRRYKMRKKKFVKKKKKKERTTQKRTRNCPSPIVFHRCTSSFKLVARMTDVITIAGAFL